MSIPRVVLGRVRSRAARLVVPALLLSTAGCFATRGDVRILQQDINTVRTESQRSAQAQAQALAEAARVIKQVSDSLTRISSRQLGFEGDTRGELRRINEQLLRVQELLGQSANILRSFRADIESSGRIITQPPVTDTPPVTGGARPPVTPPVGGSVTPNPNLPGPSQLYQDGMDHFRRSSYASARIAFSDLLLNYPGVDVAPEAQYWIAEAFAAEKNLVAAETAYAAVVSKYPESVRAPDAMYKRALMLLEQGNTAAAKPLLQQLIQRYPKSNAADFAKERLAAIP